MKLVLIFVSLLPLTVHSQHAFSDALPFEALSLPENYTDYLQQASAKKLYQRNVGMIGGLQKGKYTFIELGGEAHWRKISVLHKPHIIGATANLEYNFSQHVIGYKAGMWMKRGRINLTYGANISYHDDFNGSNSFGIGPAIGFRLLGFHLINGYTFLTNKNNSAKETSLPVNTVSMSLRYYFPVENKFVWDRKTRMKKKERKKEREKRKKERENERESGEKKGLKNFFDFGGSEKKQKEKDKENEEKKGLRKLFNFKKDDN